MKILSLSLDNSVLNKTSALAARSVEYGALVEEYTVIVPSAKNEEITSSEKVKVYGSGGGNKLTQFFKIYQVAEKLLCQNKYQVMTVQDQYYLALIGLWLSKKHKVGLEIQVHGFEKFYGLRKLIAQYVLPRADVVRCVSQRLKKQLVSQFGVLEEKITVAPIFVDTTLSLRATKGKARSLAITRDKLRNLTYSEVNQRLTCRPDYGTPRNDIKAFIFLTVGRLVSVKNIGMQIEVMAEIIKKYPKIELWIIGKGEAENNLKFKIKNLKLNDNVKMLGWQDDLQNYYSRADAFLLTSNYEGWGLAVIEAAGRDLPIIMTDVGCAGEVIKDGESGLVINVGDKQKLVEAMLKIIEDESLRKKLGIKAKLAVSRLPNKEQTLNLYKASWQKALVK